MVMVNTYLSHGQVTLLEAAPALVAALKAVRDLLDNSYTKIHGDDIQCDYCLGAEVCEIGNDDPEHPPDNCPWRMADAVLEKIGVTE